MSLLKPTPQELGVSRETFEKLDAYVRLLEKWNPAINLVSKATLADAWSRHIADSVQILQGVGEVHNWADLGSGGGFPGMVVAILLNDTRPEASVVLVESDRRKSSFLRSVSRETDVKTTIISERIENISSLGVDVLSARALASLDQLLGYSMLHRKEAGQCLFPKGARYQEEIDAARINWNFDCEVIQSKVDPSSVILKIGDIQHV